MASSFPGAGTEAPNGGGGRGIVTGVGAVGARELRYSAVARAPVAAPAAATKSVRTGIVVVGCWWLRVDT